MIFGIFYIIFSQVLMVLTQLESSSAFSVSHRMVHRSSRNHTLGEWGQGQSHVPAITPEISGLHALRKISALDTDEYVTLRKT